MKLIEVFARNVKEVRQQKSMTQAQLAQLSDLHVTYINAVENGRRNISINNIERIAKALEVEPWQLLRKEEE